MLALGTNDSLIWSDNREERLKGTEPMQAWCHGAEGVALAAAQIQAAGHSLDFPRSADAAYSSLPTGPSRCMCHGIAGRVLVSLELAQLAPTFLSASTLDRVVESLGSQLVERSYSASADRSRGEQFDVGLMTGRGGIVLALSAMLSGSLPHNPLALRLWPHDGFEACC